MTTRRKVRNVILTLVALVVVAGGYLLARSTTGALSTSGPKVPTARVTRGPLDLTVFTIGELRATRTMVINAPSVGGLLRLVTMPETGAAVTTGDMILEFDPTEQQYNLEQANSQLREAEQEIVKMRADTDVQASQDQVSLLGARFDVRRAELDARGTPGLIGANEFQKHKLALEEARRRLSQMEDDVKSRTETTRASIAMVEERRNTQRMNATRAQTNIDSLVIKAPMDGLVVARENRDASGGMFYSGMSLPEYRAGDNVNPGRPVADVFDITQMEIRSRVNEQERANLAVGQTAAVYFDALPGVKLSAKITTIGSLASRSNESLGPLREFDLTLQLENPDARVRPGTTVRLVIAGTHVENILHLPRQAVFEKNGKSIVYVRKGEGFETREVKPLYRTESRIAIEGLADTDDVALINPETAAKMTQPKSGAPAPPKTP